MAKDDRSDGPTTGPFFEVIPLASDAVIMREKDGMIRRLASRIGVHQHTAESTALQFASGLEAAFGGALAAGADYFLGSTTPSGIPELSVGPVPVVATVAVVGKLGAIFLHAAAKGNPSSRADLAANHIGAIADGLVGGAAALTTMRVLIEMKAAQVGGSSSTSGQ
jgi:hypothetical protein